MYQNDIKSWWLQNMANPEQMGIPHPDQMGMVNPAMQAYQQQQPPQQQVPQQQQAQPMKAPFSQQDLEVLVSPISKGARAGMQEARRSIMMDEDQKRQAMGAMLLNFATHNNGQGTVIENMTQAINPAMQAYQQQQVAAQKSNEELLLNEEKKYYQQQQFAYKMKEDEEYRKQKALERQDLLNYRNAKLAIDKAKNDGVAVPESLLNDVEFKSSPKLIKNDHAHYRAVYDHSSELISKIKSIENDEKKLKLLTKDDIIKQLGLDPKERSIANHVKDRYGNWFDKKDYKKVTALRTNLETEYMRLRNLAEAMALNGGKPGQQYMNKIEKDGLFYQQNDPLPTRKYKLKKFKKETDEARRASAMSLNTGRAVTPLQLERFEKISGINIPTDLDNYIEENPQLRQQAEKMILNPSVAERFNNDKEKLLRALAEVEMEKEEYND